MFPTLDPNRHWGCRINDRITWNGMRAILLQNEHLQIVILLDKGAEIIQFLYKPLDVDFLWHSANPARDPRMFVPAGGSASTPFFDHWTGGWFEVLPNGGPSCNYLDAELGTFAETINVPWEYSILEDSPSQVSIALWIYTYRTPFLLKKLLRLKSNQSVLQIRESVTNLGSEPMEFMWGHHPVVGPPFLDENCRLYAPKCMVQVFHDEDGPDHRMGLFQEEEWPFIKDRNGNELDLRVIPARSSKSMDNCYLKDFIDGWIAVINHKLGVGFGLAWDPKVFRYTWIWQAFGGGKGYPWYGRTYNMGIEPWTSYPCVGLKQCIELGTAMRLEPGQKLDAWLSAVAFEGKNNPNMITKQGDVLE